MWAALVLGRQSGKLGWGCRRSLIGRQRRLFVQSRTRRGRNLRGERERRIKDEEITDCPPGTFAEQKQERAPTQPCELCLLTVPETLTALYAATVAL